MTKQVVEEMRVSVTLLSLLLLSASLLPLSSAFDPEAGAALLLFARSANSSMIPIMRWTTPDPCGNATDGWLGVGCTFEGKVFAVNLTGILLAGTIAANTLGNVTTLTNITLQGTGLTGKLPTDLIHHPGLLSVRLNGNSFSGAIPVFGNSKSLDVLNLADNSFTSAVPPGLNGNSQLRVLRLENNLLSGDLPNLNLPLLQDFSVASNQNLSGAIPEGLIRFGESAFSGDSDLCGPPLTTSCSPAPGAPGSAPAPTKNFKKKKLTTGEIAAIILADMVLLLFITACFYIHYSKKYTKAANSEEKLKPGKKEGAKSTTITTTTTVDKSEYTPSAASQSFLDSAAAVRPVEDIAAKSRLVFFPGHPHTFDLEDLLRASAEMLGKGSFGTAYKALLEGGAEVAVKRLRDLRDSGRKEFEQQMELVGKLRHPNLIPLKAYYYAREEKLLVYDYQPNGSLYSLLHGNRQSPDRVPFDWASRLRTALGVARGLEYLHRECESQKMPHGNIKSSNILLDKDMEPCITDFGLAPLMTASMAASRLVGYRAPEYSQSKRITQKADVYSFGVLLLELLTGRIPSQSGSNGGGDGGIDLPRWVHSVVREEWTAEVFDLELMMYSDIEEEMVGLLQVAMKCVANSADARPKMSDVVKLIEDIRGPDPYGDETTDFSSEMSESGLTPVAESPLPRT